MYAKVFAQIYDGTLCTIGPWEALVTFQQLLVLADQDGNVDMTATAISRRTTIPLNIIEKGIESLLKPDPESRTPNEDGKRIVPLAEGRTWGWSIVNYQFYRQLKREEDRRAYHREYWHRRKLNNTQQTQPNQPIAEAYAEAKAEEVKSREKTQRATRLPKDWAPDDEGFLFCKNKRPDLDPHETLERFRDYWTASGKTKLDWNATWRTWVRNEKQAVKSYAVQKQDAAKKRIDDLTGRSRTCEPDSKTIDMA